MNQAAADRLQLKWKKYNKNSHFYFLLLVVCCLLNVLLSGCSPTYPKGKTEESIVKLCKHEYNLDVKVEIIGKTIAIYLPLPDLLDQTFNMTKSAGEKINDVMLCASRVTLSTDEKFNFYCVIIHDIRIPEIQMIAIRYVNDIKRGFLGDISRDESFRRMVIDFRLSPQSQKERAIKEVFEKMSLDKKWREEVMNDFFRSGPSVLGEIGYWNDRFYIKDITMEEFLADQVANRIKIEFREDKPAADEYSVKSARGFYNDKLARRYFKFEVLAEAKWFKDIDDGRLADRVFQKGLETAAHVMHAYNFDKFEYIEIINQSDGKTLRVSKDLLENFRKKKATFKEIVAGKDQD